MIQGAVQDPCYETRLGGWDGDMYNGVLLENSFDGGATRLETQLMLSVHFGLSILKQKVSEVESFFKLCYAQPVHHGSTSSMAAVSMADLMQEIVKTASSMMLDCQVMALGSVQEGNDTNSIVNNSLMSGNQEAYTLQKTDNGLAHQSNVNGVDEFISQGFLDGDSFYDWYTNDTTYNNNNTGVNTSRTTTTTVGGLDERNGSQMMSNNIQEWEVSLQAAYDVVELDAEELLARYTHCCQVCGRGFKRETNLRMHMRAHGDEYKSSLIGNPPKKTRYEENKTTTAEPPRKYYSCPHNGCKWNKNHMNFQPLKSMVCVRNHYKRSHCPKMFVCNRCNTKEFSVLSDLKTHEKHCGNIKWYCSCGTSFSKKDKLMDHVALFFGHTPSIYP